MSSLRRDIRAHSANYDCSKWILISFSRSLLVPHDILIYCPNFLVLGMQSGQMNYFKAFILRGFFYNAINITFRSPSIFYIYIYIYITADSTVSAFWASSVQCWCLGWRLSLKSHPKCPTYVVHLSHARASIYIYIYIYIYSLTSQNSYNDLPTKLLGALFVKVFHW